MKTILFLLFSITILAQEFTDTLYLIDGRSYPCCITELNKSEVNFIYSNNRAEKTSIKAIDKIYLEDHGVIYNSSTGFNNDPEEYVSFLSTRLILFEDKSDDKIINKIEEEPAVEKFCFSYHKETNHKNNNWSFGVLLIPYYSGIIYTISEPSYPPYEPDIYGSAVNQINMEAQLSYALMNDLSISLDLTYTASYFENRTEYHSRGSSGYNVDGGSFRKNDITLFDFSLGFKYYINDIFSEQVRVFALAGLGKQLAFVEEKYEQLFSDPTPGITPENNMEEFMEDINSPFHFNLGFGAEYFFNRSLSITSNIRVIYSSSEGKYNSRTITQVETYTISEKLKETEILTRVGIGLNFYF